MNHKVKRVRFSVATFVLLVLLTALAPMSAAGAPIIVGSGTAESCTEAALQNALTAAELNGGGTVKFKCGGGAVTIAVTEWFESTDDTYPAAAALIPSNGTTIDGSDLVTLSFAYHCHSGAAFVFVKPNTTVVLTNLRFDSTGCSAVKLIFNAGTLTLKSSVLSDQVSMIDNNGTLTVEGSDIIGTLATPSTGAAILSSGTLTVRNTLFSGNLPICTVRNFGVAVIVDSEFSDNGNELAPVCNEGTLIVKHSVFSDNNGWGGVGGIRNWPEGSLLVNDSVFSGNIGGPFGVGGGGIENIGTLTVKNSVFSGNHAFSGGGGVLNSGIANIKDSEFYDNVAESWSGPPGPSPYASGGGGGIANLGTLTVSNSVLSGNQALSPGKGVSGYGGGIANLGTLTVKDSTITNNAALYQGGGIYTYGGGTLKLKSTSVTDNTPDNIVTVP